MDIKALVVDCDDTLVDSMWMWRSVMPEFLGRYADAEAVQRHLEAAETMGADEGMALFVERNNPGRTAEELKGELLALVHEHYAHDIHAIPGVKGFLDSVRDAGVPMAVASCTELPEVLVGLEANGLEGYFERVYSVSQGLSGKTEPAMWLAAARDFGLDPAEVLVVDDSLVAARTAKRAGFPVLGLTWESSRHTLPEMEAVADVALPRGWEGVTLATVLEGLDG